MIRYYLFGDFSEDHEPTVLDACRAKKMVNGKNVNVTIHDTPGDDYLTKKRTEIYLEADCL